MGFLGQVFKGGQRFLGQAAKGAAYLGKNSAKISSAASSFSQLASNPAVQQAAQKIGGSKALGALRTGSNFIAGGNAALPGLRDNAQMVGAALGQGKRSIADLYRAANA